MIAPKKELKNIQRQINREILNKIWLSESCHSRKSRSILTNAKNHINKPCLIKLDIKSFYPSVHYKRVLKMFEKIGFDKKTAGLLTKLTTYNYGLPYGAPTSSMIGNIILSNLDERIYKFCQIRGYKNSRWVDDIAVSGGNSLKNFIPLLKKIIRQEGFKVNEKKVKAEFHNERQEVTGISVNIKPNIPSHHRKRILLEIFKIKNLRLKTGLNLNQALINKEKSLKGYINFANQINPKFAAKLNQLI